MFRLPIISEDDDSDIVSLEVEGHTSDTWSELDHFSCLDFVESDNTSDTVSDADNSSELFDIILDGGRGTTWVMLRILSWITLAVSAMLSFLEEKPRTKRISPCIYVEYYYK